MHFEFTALGEKLSNNNISKNNIKIDSSNFPISHFFVNLKLLTFSWIDLVAVPQILFTKIKSNYWFSRLLRVGQNLSSRINVILSTRT